MATKKLKNLKTEKYRVSAIVIAKNEEKKIGDCLESLKWVDEVVVVDTGSTDRTLGIAKTFGAKIAKFKGGSYADWRNKGLNEISGDWVFYVDADERSTPDLEGEIRLATQKEGNTIAYAVPRKNLILGQEMKYGGWWPDYVKRLYKKDKLEKWVGGLHEEPVFEGKLGILENPLIHSKHDNLDEMVEKSNSWSEKEAKLLLDANHPKMAGWRFLRIMATELFYRLIWLRGFLDGPKGVIYAFYQMWYRFMVYAKLWEMQLRNSKFKMRNDKLKSISF